MKAQDFKYDELWSAVTKTLGYKYEGHEQGGNVWRADGQVSYFDELPNWPTDIAAMIELFPERDNTLKIHRGKRGCWSVEFTMYPPNSPPHKDTIEGVASARYRAYADRPDRAMVLAWLIYKGLVRPLSENPASYEWVKK